MSMSRSLWLMVAGWLLLTSVGNVSASGVSLETYTLFMSAQTMVMCIAFTV